MVDRLGQSGPSGAPDGDPSVRRLTFFDPPGRVRLDPWPTGTAVREPAAGVCSTRSGVRKVAGPAAAFSASLEHCEQTTTPPSCTIQLPSSAVVTFSLLRPQSEQLPFAGSCCVTRPMVPTSAPVNGGWWEVAPQAIPWVEHPFPIEAPNLVKERLGHLVTGLPSMRVAQYAGLG